MNRHLFGAWLLAFVVACGGHAKPKTDAAAADASDDASPSLDANVDGMSHPTEDAAIDAAIADGAITDAGLDAEIADAGGDALVDAFVDAASDANFSCDEGYERVGSECLDIDECASDNGGCDVATVCENAAGTFTCGACRVGYVGNATAGCYPRLVALGVTEAVIEPTFNAEVFSYAVSVGLNEGVVHLPLDVASLEFSVTANDATVFGNLAVVGVGIGDNEIDLDVTGENGLVTRYVVNVNRAPHVMPHAHIKASNRETNDEFGGWTANTGNTFTGSAIAMSGDTLVVGAHNEDSDATTINGNEGNNNSYLDRGAAYVYVRDGIRWTKQAYLKAHFRKIRDEFGKSVAIDGDTIVVGAPNDDGAPGTMLSSDGGAAYVFVRTGGVWTQQAYLQAALVGNGDRFGTSVSISGDTIVVGAPQEDSTSRVVNGDANNNGAVDSGAAYVFVRNGTTWTQQAFLKAYNGDGSDAFGATVVVRGDQVAIGAVGEDSDGVTGGFPQYDNGAMDSGAVYVFTRSDVTWTQQAWLKASNIGAGDHFGTSLALSTGLLAVGAPREASAGDPNDDSLANAGAVYLFTETSGTWGAPVYLKAPVIEMADEFGQAVAIEGNVLAVGAHGDDGAGIGTNPTPGADNNDAADSGAVFLFARDGNTWTQTTYLKPFVRTPALLLSTFGAGVVLNQGSVVVAAPRDTSSGVGINPTTVTPFTLTNSGAVYVFR